MADSLNESKRRGVVAASECLRAARCLRLALDNVDSPVLKRWLRVTAKLADQCLTRIVKENT